MKTTRVMSLVTAAVFALGMAGSALAQTPTTPAPSTTPAPNAPAKGDSMHFQGSHRCEAMRQCYADPTIR